MSTLFRGKLYGPCLFKMTTLKEKTLQNLTSGGLHNVSNLKRIAELQYQMELPKDVIQIGQTAIAWLGVAGSFINILVLKNLKLANRSYIKTHVIIAILEFLISLICTI